MTEPLTRAQVREIMDRVRLSDSGARMAGKFGFVPDAQRLSDALLAAWDEIDSLQVFNRQLAERIAVCADLLAKRAERKVPGR